MEFVYRREKLTLFIKRFALIISLLKFGITFDYWDATNHEAAKKTLTNFISGSNKREQAECLLFSV